jgi:hypothetical protein
LIALERCNAEFIETAWNMCRDWRDAWYEIAFHAIYCSPLLHGISEHARLTRGINREEDLRQRADIVQLLTHIEQGGYSEAVIRMLVLLAQARGSVRRSRLERSNAILHAREPFSSLAPEVRARIIQEQSTIVYLEPERALASLKVLLPTEPDRRKALDLVLEIAGPEAEMNDPTLMMLAEFKAILRLPSTHEPDQMPVPMEAAV